MKRKVEGMQRAIPTRKVILAACVASLALVVSAIETTGVEQKTYSKVLTLTVTDRLTLEQALKAHGIESVAAFTSAKYDKLVKEGRGTLLLDQDIQAFAGDIFVEDGRLSVTYKYGLGKRTAESFVVVRGGATLEYGTPATYGAKTVYFEGEGIDSLGAIQVTDSVDSTSEFWKDVVFVMTGDATVRVTSSTSKRKTASFLKSAALHMNGHAMTAYFGSNDFQFSFGAKVQDKGVFVIKSGNVFLNAALQLPKDPTSGSSVRLDGCKVNFLDESYPQAFWPLVVASSPSAFKVSEVANAVWQGSLVLLADTYVRYVDDASLTLQGGLSGVGQMMVEGGGTLRLGCGRESFGGKLVATDGVVQFIDAARVCPGLVAGYSSDPYPAGHSIVDEWNDVRMMPTLTNEVEVTSFARLQNAGVEMPGSGKQVYTYSGYIMNTDNVARTWAFLCNFKHRVDLRIGDGSETLFENWDKYTEVRAARAVLQPGANPFVFKCWVNATKGGRYTSLKDSAGKTYPAFAIIRDVDESVDLPSTLVSDWEQITGDPGDGSLFRVARSDAEIYGLESAGLLSRPNAKLEDLKLELGSSVMLGGNFLTVDTLSGAGTVTQTSGDLSGNSFRIEGDWNLSADEQGVWPVLVSDVPVVFGDNARLVLDVDSIRRGRASIVLSSPAGVSGLPTLAFSDGRSRKYSLRLTADGKALEVIPPGMLFVVK